MVTKHSQELPVHYSTAKSGSGHVVLLTGSTGTLGTYILQQLLNDPRVTRVYALNRPSAGKDMWSRQSESLLDRGVNLTVLDSAKLELIEGDTTKADLGLNGELLNEIKSSLTTIIHNAWRLDFNLSLSSFESHVKGARHLVDLALSTSGPSPPQFIFTSTIGTLSNWCEPRAVPEEVIEDPAVALGNGYGQSKWVTERILLAAVEQRGLPATIWRVGQLSGSSTNGAWNTTDWVPIVAKSGAALGALPSSPQAKIDWLPTDVAARAIAESMHASLKRDERFRYLNLVHPSPTRWDSIFEAMSKLLGVPLIPFKDWVVKVEQESEQGGLGAADRVPAIKLLDFFRRISGSESADSEGSRPAARTGQTVYETNKAVQLSETLRNLPQVDEKDVGQWLEYWRKHGLFD